MENPSTTTPTTTTVNPLTVSFAGEINKFGAQLLSLLIKDTGKNVFVSPLSVVQLMTMITNGADGQTLTQLTKGLHLDTFKNMDQVNECFQHLMGFLNKHSEDIIMKNANSVWVDPKHKIKDTFGKLTKEFYTAECKSLTTTQEVNKWVEHETNGKIPKILDSISGLALVLINAIYFKGLFEISFDETLTKKDKFHATTGDMDVQMMQQQRTFNYKETDKCQAIQLEYKSKQVETCAKYFTTVILPKQNGDLDTILNGLCTSTDTLSGFKKADGTLFMPKFKIEFQSSLKKVMQQLGIQKAFTKEAEFTKVCEPADLSISDVLHKTFLEVNEKGAEAAAVTIGKMHAMVIEKKFLMKVDKPFLFVIQEQFTKAIVFIGKIEKPECI